MIRTLGEIFASPDPGEQGDTEGGREGEAMRMTRTLVPRGGDDTESLNPYLPILFMNKMLREGGGGQWGEKGRSTVCC